MNRRNQAVKDRHHIRNIVLGTASVPLLMGSIVTDVQATEPCDDFGECKVLIEINASDGDIGFHWLIDGDDLNSVRMDDPNGAKVYENKAFGPLRDQKLTETFGESAEPVCRASLAEEEDDVVVTLEEFLERWSSGFYNVSGSADGGEKLFGMTELTHNIPAAPDEVDLTFDMITNTYSISWEAGSDLGECATEAELEDLFNAGVIPVEPKNVPVDAYEIVLEPDVEDGDPTGNLVFSVRVAGDINPMSVTVPPEYLDSLPDDTPVKIEVGAIGGEDNATFTEEDGFCINEVEGCED